MPKTYDVIRAADAQARYCEEHEMPLFAPTNGWCNHCGRNIYAPSMYSAREGQTHGFSVEEAGSRHITGCPHCSHSFVE